MAVPASLRASDADRDRVAERLRKAAGEGRLLTEELEERLEAAFSARTYGQLDALLADLPGGRPTRRPRRRAPLGSALAFAVVLAALTAVLLAVVFVATGVFAAWVLWIVFGWFFFARGRRHHCQGRRGAWGPPGAAWSGRRERRLSA